MRTALVGARLIDGTGTDPKPDTTVVIEDSKISAVDKSKEFDSDTKVLDVSGKTVMPGLIDSHNHLAPLVQYNVFNQKHHHAGLFAKVAYFMRGLLSSGITTSIDMGGLEAGFVTAQKMGWLEGPRLQTGIVIIGPTNGLSSGGVPGIGAETSPQGITAQPPAMPMSSADGPWECRKKVREVLRAGADFIKIANTGTPYDSKLDPSRVHFTKEELEAIVDEAHMAGVRVCCHCLYSAPATLAAVKAGVDTIEHGTVMDEACVEEMVKRGTWLIPMFYISHWHSANNPSPAARAFNAAMIEKHVASFQLAYKAGVKIVTGTDAVADLWGIHTEMGYMVEAGMKPDEAIYATTGLAAQCSGIDDQVGTLEPGKEADLIVVDGDPLADINVLNNTGSIELVMQAGKAVAGPSMTEFPWEKIPFDNATWLFE